MPGGCVLNPGPLLSLRLQPLPSHLEPTHPRSSPPPQTLRARRKVSGLPEKVFSPASNERPGWSRRRAVPGSLCSLLSRLGGVLSSLESSPARVHSRAGGGAPGPGLVTRFPPLSSYDLPLLLPPPPAPPPPTFPVLCSSLRLLSSSWHPTRLTPSHCPSPAATLTRLGRGGARGRGRLPALRSSATISGNATLVKLGRMQQVLGAWRCASLTQEVSRPPSHLPPPPPPRKETLPGCQGGDSRVRWRAGAWDFCHCFKGQSSGRFQKLSALMEI